MIKRGILVVSFGTTYIQSYEKNILTVENRIKEEFADYHFESAYTSGMIIKALSKKGIKINDVASALNKMLNEGVEEVYIQPTHIIPGEEYEKICAKAEEFKNRFKLIKIGKPLLWTTEDIFNVIDIIGKTIVTEDDEAVVLMGHGSSHFADTVYAAMDYMFKARGYKNIYVATVEGYPMLEDISDDVCNRFSRIILTPLMLVAGDHAENDMAGDEDSWKTYFEDKGKEVRVILKGLGEYEKIRELYVEHIKKYLVV